MKKIYIILIACLLLITGCNKKENKVVEKKNSNINEHKTDKSYVVVSLYSNPSTGYNWSYKIDNENVEVEEKYDSHCEQNQVGCGGIMYYYIYGLKKGKSKITFNYSRGKDKTEYDKTAIHEVEVDENLNVINISQKGTYYGDKK